MKFINYFSKEIKGSDRKVLSALVKVFINAVQVSKLYGGLMLVKKDSTSYGEERREDVQVNAWKNNSLTWRDFCWKNQIHFL